jgi:hypothetical protein
MTGATAGIDDECLRPQQRFDVVEPQNPHLAVCNESRRGRIEDAGCAFDFSRERSDAGLTCSALGPRQRRSRDAGPQTPDGDPGDANS